VTGSGSGLAGVTVTVTDGHGDTVGTATTGGNGTYTVPDVPAGTYSVEFSKSPAWESTTKDGVQVAQGETVTLDAELVAAPGKISGTVTAADGGDALADVTVTVYDPDSGAAVGTADTGANGRYTVTGVAAGEYELCFNAD